MFADRLEAAEHLAQALQRYRSLHPLILAIPRGAVPMGAVLARRLGGELDVVMVRKLRAPGAPEFAVGAIDEMSWAYVAPHAETAGATPEFLEEEKRRQLREMRRRRALYTPGRLPVDAKGRTVVVVDDGLATGATMIAALHAVRERKPARLVCAVPVASPDSLEQVRPYADEIVCLQAPAGFRTVEQFYRSFPQVEDEEVVAWLGAGSTPPPRAGDALIVIDVQNDFLAGGALPVPGGDEVIPVLSKMARRFDAANLPIFATRDWHDPAHSSFLPQGGAWPPHCVAGSQGAAFPMALVLPAATTVISKGTRSDVPGYSAFAGTDLDARLRRQGVRRLFVGGLATDYCVLHTVRDALSHGYAVVLLGPAIRAVDVRPGDGEQAVAQMRACGARVLDELPM